MSAALLLVQVGVTEVTQLPGRLPSLYLLEFHRCMCVPCTQHPSACLPKAAHATAAVLTGCAAARTRTCSVWWHAELPVVVASPCRCSLRLLQCKHPDSNSTPPLTRKPKPDSTLFTHCCRLLGSEAELAASLPGHITVRASHIASAEREFCTAA